MSHSPTPTVAHKHENKSGSNTDHRSLLTASNPLGWCLNRWKYGAWTCTTADTPPNHNKKHPNARGKKRWCNMMQLEAWTPGWLTADWLIDSLLIRSAGQPGLVWQFFCLRDGARFEVKELTKSKYKVIGVIYQNWEAWDGDEWCQGIPEESGRTLLLLSCIAESPRKS